MKILTILTIPILLVSCGGSSKPSGPYLDPEFKETYTKYTAELKSRGITPQMKFNGAKWSQTPMENIAEYLPGSASIRVAPRAKDLSKNELSLLLLHEFSHALLGIGDGLVKGNDHIMSQGNFSKELKANPWQDKYLDSLFDPKLYGTLKRPFVKPPLTKTINK